jgi:hypothetical protein
MSQFPLIMSELAKDLLLRTQAEAVWMASAEAEEPGLGLPQPMEFLAVCAWQRT